jgi:hypothetical protein
VDAHEKYALVCEKLADGSSLSAVRASIIDFILGYLDQHAGPLDYWETLHLGYAISALSMNMARKNTDSPVWLNLCMATLDKALVPKERRNENYTPRRSDVERITIEQLRRAANVLREQAGE